MRSRPPPQVQEARRTPDPHLESHSLSRFPVPAGTGMPGRLEMERTKGKVWAIQACLSRLIKWFPDQGRGAPLDSLQERLFSRKSASSPPPPPPTKRRQVQGAEPGSLPSKLSQWLCLHSQQTPAAPLRGPKGTIHLQGTPPEEASRAQS